MSWYKHPSLNLRLSLEHERANVDLRRIEVRPCESQSEFRSRVERCETLPDSQEIVIRGVVPV